NALSMSLGTTVNSWVFLSGINVMTDKEQETIVCFGDSITDGVGSVANANNRYPDYLARLCKQNPATANISVLNKGIGGNAVISGSVGPMAKDRFEKDALMIDGVKYIVLLEGINDIGKAAADDSYSTDIINTYKDFIDKAHEKGIKIYCGTILPCGNFSGYYSAKEEKLRSEINTWIRSDESGFDGIVDFDAALQDPSNPVLLKSEYDCGDGLHPSPAGYELMGSMVYNMIFGE
ncbi:MAG: SGNH/GDSL hydrolase family protein, partial [Candidatus Ornithomonoglobus sp.]